MSSQVKDNNGQILHGIKRSVGGGLVVENSDELQKYRHEVQVRQDIEKLKQEIHDLKILVEKLLDD